MNVSQEFHEVYENFCKAFRLEDWQSCAFCLDSLIENCQTEDEEAVTVACAAILDTKVGKFNARLN